MSDVEPVKTKSKKRQKRAVKPKRKEPKRKKLQDESEKSDGKVESEESSDEDAPVEHAEEEEEKEKSESEKEQEEPMEDGKSEDAEKEKEKSQEEEKKPKKRQGRKKKTDAEPVQEEEENKSKSSDEPAAEAEGEKPKKKRGPPKKPRAPRPKKERPKKFRKGKWNPDIVPVTEDRERDLPSSELLNTCCSGCANRNSTRAVLTNNEALLAACIASPKLCTLYDSWGPELKYNSFYYAMASNNVKMALDLLRARNLYRPRARPPSFLIKYLDTGMVCQQAFGVQVRKVQMARGNRQGNNAFLEKEITTEVYSVKTIKDILESPNLTTDTLEKLMVLEPSITATIYSNIVRAILAGNRKVAAFLIDKIKAFPNYGFNELHSQVLSLDGADLPEFFKASVHKKASENEQVTPTHCACINPDPKYIKAMYEADPNLQLVDAKNRKPIHYAAACTGSGPLDYLLKQGANVNDLDANKRSTLHYAAMFNRGENVKIILDAAPLLFKSKDTDGMMPIHYAARDGQLEAIKAFVEKAATQKINLNIGGGSARMSPLAFAAAHDQYEVCQYLAEHKGRVMGKDKFKRTPLILAARNGNAKVLSFLLQHGALWDEPDSSGNTALHYAAAYGWVQCAEILLKAGSNVNANSSWKISPLNIAMLKNHHGMVKYLLNQPGIDVNCKDEKGRTLLSLAVGLEDCDETLAYIEYLLKEKHADPNIADLSGNTPLYYLVTR